MKAVTTKNPNGSISVMLPYEFTGCSPAEVLDQIDLHPISKYLSDKEYEAISDDLDDVYFDDDRPPKNKEGFVLEGVEKVQLGPSQPQLKTFIERALEPVVDKEYFDSKDKEIAAEEEQVEDQMPPEPVLAEWRTELTMLTNLREKGQENMTMEEWYKLLDDIDAVKASIWSITKDGVV